MRTLFLTTMMGSVLYRHADLAEAIRAELAMCAAYRFCATRTDRRRLRHIGGLRF